jgi:hypothetical protein
MADGQTAGRETTSSASAAPQHEGRLGGGTSPRLSRLSCPPQLRRFAPEGALTAGELPRSPSTTSAAQIPPALHTSAGELAVCIATHFLLQHPGRLSATGAESRLPQRRIIEPASDALDRHHPRDLVVAPTPRTPDRAYLVCHLTPPLGLSRGYDRSSSACGWPAMWNTQFARFGAGHLEVGEPIAVPVISHAVHCQQLPLPGAPLAAREAYDAWRRPGWRSQQPTQPTCWRPVVRRVRPSVAYAPEQRHRLVTPVVELREVRRICRFVFDPGNRFLDSVLCLIERSPVGIPGVVRAWRTS